MSDTDVNVVNEALALTGFDGAPVTGSAPTFDSSIMGKNAARLYVPAVQAVARQFEWDFSRQVVLLGGTGNVAPFPWTKEFVYPALAVQVWQVTPTGQADANDPLPVNFAIGNAQVGGVSTKVIWCNLNLALAVYNGLPPVAVWDAGFRAAVVRLLASEFAMAGAGKPEAAQGALESFGQFIASAAERPS